MMIEIKGKDIVWSYLGALLSMAANIVMIPFLVYYLDENLLGLWYVFCSIGAMTALFDFGFATTFARNITYCFSGAKKLCKENIDESGLSDIDWQLMKNILYACQKIYFFISSIVIILLMTCGTMYIQYISTDVNGYNHYFAWVIYVFAIFLNLYYGYYAAFLRGVGAIVDVNKNIVYSRILQLLATVVLLYYGYGLISACIGYLVYGFTFRYLGRIKFYRYQGIGKKLYKYKIENKKASELIHIVWHNAWKDGVVSFSNYFSDQASVIICSLYLSLADTGMYSLTIQIATSIGLVATILYAAEQPELQSAYISNDRKRIIDIMSTIIVTFIFLFVTLLILVIFVGIPVLNIIKPDINISIRLLLFLSLYQFILKFRNCYTSYFSCTNRIPYYRSFIISSILTIILGVALTGYFNYGVYGLVIAQLFSQIIFNMWYWQYKVHLELRISFWCFFKNGVAILVNSLGKIICIKPQ